MHRSEHFRGRLLSGNDTILDPVQGQLRYQVKPNSRQTEWSGFLELPAEGCEALVSGSRYRLILLDGRSGDVYVNTPHVDPLDRCVADFHGTGVTRR